MALDRLRETDEPRAGGKAFNCARLRQAGFPVPDGMVVMATAGDTEIAAVPEHAWLSTIPADVGFAVRSSGIGEDGTRESFAGIHQTLLNVARADLAAAVAACRASAHGREALEYRRVMKMPVDTIQMGVLIQRMVHPMAAGVAFSVNPVTGAEDELVINSSWGLGEALVSGQIDPDEFVVGKHDGVLRWARLGGKGDDTSTAASLAPDAVGELARMVADIERHCGTPQDVEWCHDGTRFWIVQSRPITTGAHVTGEIEWTRANVGEVLPDLTSPQALSVFEEMLDVAERRFLRSLAAPEEELGPIVKAFHGRLYFNLSQLRRVCALGNIAPAMMLRSMGHADTIQPSDEVASRPSLRMQACLPDLFRLAGKHLRAQEIVRQHDVRTNAYLAQFGSVDPRELTDERLWAFIDRWFREAPDYMQPVLLLGGVLFHEAPVRQACDAIGIPFEELVYPQLAAGERSVSTQQAYDLEALADLARNEPAVASDLMGVTANLARMRVTLRGTTFLARFEQFLEKYGHRGRYEYDWSLPRYNEDPAPLLRAIRIHLEEGARSGDTPAVAGPERDTAAAWRAFEQRLSRRQKWTTLPSVRRAIGKIKQYYVWREQVRSDLVRVLGVLRVWHLVLADRFVARGWLNDRQDYFLLRYREVGSIISGQFAQEAIRAIVAGRRAEQEGLRSLQMPLLMRPSQLPALIRTAGVSGGSESELTLTGQPVSRGCVEGEVVVVRDPGDFGRMKRGAILVAPATDPSWTPLFTLAAGVIVEVGGVLSHASTIAREYGLPALANVRLATKRLRTGERIRLDANQGVIERLSPNPTSAEESATCTS